MHPQLGQRFARGEREVPEHDVALSHRRTRLLLRSQRQHPGQRGKHHHQSILTVTRDNERIEGGGNGFQKRSNEANEENGEDMFNTLLIERPLQSFETLIR